MTPEDIDCELPDDGLDAIPEKGYSIRVASRMTGLSVDTLRMWERRYAFPSPLRNGAGNRLYGEADVERLILIARAMKVGYRAGEAIRMREQELTQVLASQPPARTRAGDDRSTDVARLLDLVRSDDAERLRHELRRITGVIGAKRFVADVAGPFTEAIGEAWAVGALRVHQEHLATAVLAAHLRLMSEHHACATGPRIMLATLPREQHSLGLEMAALMASLAGATVETLGPDCPTNEIVQAASALRVQAVALSISLATAPAAVLAHVEWMAEHLPTPLGFWLGGKGAGLVDALPNRVRLLHDWKALDDAVAGLARGL